MDILDDSGKQLKLGFNQKFAEKFERTKRREAIQQARERVKALGVNPEQQSSDSESDEDSDAELITSKVNQKFLKAIQMIRENDPKLKDPNTKLFDDSDFESDKEVKIESKPLYFKDQYREALLTEGKFEEDKPKIISQEKQAKDNFLKAVKQWENGNQDGDLLNPRQVSQQEINDTNQLFYNFAQKEARIQDNNEIQKLKQFWTDNQDQDQEFLSKFILGKHWAEQNELMTYNEIVEQQDQLQVEEADLFESAYNHRYEETGFDTIKQYPRDIPDSVRVKENPRKKARELKKLRKEQEKQEKLNELNQLQQLKQQEFQDKLDRIKRYSGVEDFPLEEQDLEEDFDPDRHDAMMAKIFNKKYFKKSDNHPEIDQVQNSENTNEIDIQKIEQQQELPISMRQGNENDWWLCDNCQNGIDELKWRFDCLECENYTLCDHCRMTTEHPHRLKKIKIPQGCKPPQNLITILCDICSKNITHLTRFDCQTCKDFSVCEDCQPINNHEHELVNSADILWDSLLDIGYEDIISGVPCRFKYRKVERDDYGLTEEEILNWDDKTLKQYVSTKKLAPYRSDQGHSNKRMLKRKKKFLAKHKKPSKPAATEYNRLDSYNI